MCMFESEEVDLSFVFSSRFHCVGADDGQVQTIGGERPDFDLETWTRDGSKDGWIPG